MRHFLAALAGLGLIAQVACGPVAFAREAQPAARDTKAAASHPTKARAKKQAARAAAAAAEAPPPELSADARRVATWVAATTDNQGLPYIIIDKQAARLTLFSAAGEAIGQSPVLIGLAPGDQSTPGVGSKNLAEIGTAEKTTPAGRFLARFGLAGGHQQVLWVDYANSVALHPIPPTANPKEQRRQRMLSPNSADHRITFGCINVPKGLYKAVVPLFRKQGGYVYVLPDQLALEDVFPLLRGQPVIQLRAEAVSAESAAPATGPSPAR